MPIYLDHHTISRPSSAVIDRMNLFFREKWGTILAPHQKGQELYPAIDEALKKIHSSLEASDQTYFILTPGGREANFQFFLSFYLDEIRETGKNHILAPCTEEAPILLSLNRLEELDCVVKLLPVDEKGRLRLDELEAALKTKTALLTFSWANGLTGVIQPVQQIVNLCHAKGVKVHVDGSHAIGKIGLSFDESAIDFFSFDGDKIQTPQGIGGLFQRTKPKETHPNAAALCGLAVALENEFPSIEMTRLRDAFEAELKYALPDCIVLFQDVERLPHISAVAFPGVMAESLLYALNRRNVFASMGGGHHQKLSSHLKNCGLEDAICNSAISFALSPETTEEDLADSLDVIVSSVRKLKTLSAFL